MLLFNISIIQNGRFFENYSFPLKMVLDYYCSKNKDYGQDINEKQYKINELVRFMSRSFFFLFVLINSLKILSLKVTRIITF